jgi:hypothetical protein
LLIWLPTPAPLVLPPGLGAVKVHGGAEPPPPPPPPPPREELELPPHPATPNKHTSATINHTNVFTPNRAGDVFLIVFVFPSSTKRRLCLQ